MKKTRSDKAKKPKEKHVSLIERMDDACYVVKPAPDKETGRRYARGQARRYASRSEHRQNGRTA